MWNSRTLDCYELTYLARAVIMQGDAPQLALVTTVESVTWQAGALQLALAASSDD